MDEAAGSSKSTGGPLRQPSEDLFADLEADEAAAGTPRSLLITQADLDDEETNTPDQVTLRFASQNIPREDVEGKGICSFGEHDKKNLCSPLPHDKLHALSQQECVALVWASGKWRADHLATVCLSHRNLLLGAVEPLPGPVAEVCCDPFNKHKKKITNVRRVTYLTALKSKDRGIVIHAGQWLCSRCRIGIMDLPPIEELSPISLRSTSLDHCSGVSAHSEISPTIAKIDASRDLQTFGFSPIEVMQRSKAARIAEAQNKMKNRNMKVVEKLCILFDLRPEDLEEQKMSEDFEDLLSKIKAKLSTASRKEKLQLLTLCPASWSAKFAASFFGVSRYFIKKAVELRNEKGILATPISLHRSRIDESVKDRVKAFYESNDNSRIMPGKKDKVSMGKGVNKQKILLLSNLKELYLIFIKENPSLKIGFSLFCSLRPKWCVPVGTPGTHSVCVCKIHQNVKLLIHALPLKEDYRDIINNIVCDPTNRDCMMRICQKCPKASDIETLLREKVLEAVADEDLTEEDKEEILEEKIEYQEWVGTDREEIKTYSATILDVVEITARKLMTLIPHHYVNIKQKEYLKEQKENLPPTKAIVLMDFSMNYSCTIQDAIQSYHWAKKQATLHPVVIYYRDQHNVLCHKSICFISDDCEHDTAQVQLAMKNVTDYLKASLNYVTEIEYFTDGCAQQYKCAQSFLNLCRHEELFGIKARWSFFATSHGKSPCDGIGGTVKREATRASLQRPLQNQILDAQKLFQFCCEQLSREISFIFLSKESVEAKRIEQKLFGVKPSTVPGTRTFHCFVPIGGFSIECKRFSSDKAVGLMHRLSSKRSLTVHMKEGDFTLLQIDGQFHVGFITDLDANEEEADVTLLVPPIPSNTFTWPDEVQSFYVPYPHIFCTLHPQELPDNMYKLSHDDECKVKLIVH